VPAGCLLGAWRLLRDIEVPRLRAWERSFYPSTPLGSASPREGAPADRSELALGALLAVASAIVVVFVWLNLAIIDVFAQGPDLVIPTERLPARDLSMSIGWAIYGLVLLALGMRRGSMALRFVSLGLVLVTAGKVFLYDLAHLTDLYRVGSFAGLALSLLFISVAYQRFVFRQPDLRPAA